jgi:hypothetical protein
MAQFLLEREPEKARGGSKKRQDWLRLVLAFQMIAIDNDVEAEFRKELLGGND